MKKAERSLKILKENVVRQVLSLTKPNKDQRSPISYFTKKITLLLLAFLRKQERPYFIKRPRFLVKISSTRLELAFQP